MADETPQGDALRAALGLDNPTPLAQGAPLPGDLKAQATLMIRAIAARANQETGKELYPRPDRIVVTAIELRTDGMAFKIAWPEPDGSGENLVHQAALRKS